MSTAMIEALSSNVLGGVAFFVQATFLSGPVYLWTGYGPITWNGQTWQGVGTMGGISVIEEGSNVEAKGITLTLSGFDTTLLPDVLNEFALLLPVYVWFGLFNEGVLIDNPIPCFSGLMDQPTIDIDGKTSTISINCESKLLSLDVAVDRRYSADDQQRDWPGDLGMNWVNSIQEITLLWGQATVSGANL
jgi:hypothetical protein